VIDTNTAILGTNQGLLRWTNDREEPQPLPAPANVEVVGHPWLGPDGSINWRLADGSGVLRGNRTGDSWETVTEQLPPRASPVAALPDRRLLAVVGDVLTVRTDSATGTTWEPFAPAPNIKPLGVVYSASANAPFVFSAACEVERFVP
jgi:hypothetical protein